MRKALPATEERLEELRHLAGFYADDGSLRNTIAKLANRILRMHCEHGGSTTGWNGKPINRGYAVAARTPSVTLDLIDAESLRYFLGRWKGWMMRNDFVPGTWADTDNAGTEMILCTRIFRELPAAHQFAAAQRQRYIWNLSLQQAIPTMEWLSP